MSRQIRRAAIALHLSLAIGLVPEVTIAATGHRVQPGETLGAIAENYGVTAADLAAVNGLGDPNLIFAGSELLIPDGTTTAPGPGGTYRVQPGDTLGEIADARGTTVAALLSANPGLADPDLIVAGQLLALPAIGQGAAPTSMTAAILRDAANRYRLDPTLIQALAWQESGWQQDVVSSAGALGLMQVLPETADWVAADIVGRPLDVAGSATDNAEAGVALFAWLLAQSGDEELALAYYVQGQGSVARDGLFPETRDYIAAIAAIRATIARTGAPPA